MAEVAKIGLDALAHNRANRIANADIVEGLLFGLDVNGEIVVADAATKVKAVGIIPEGSPSNWGAATTFSKTSTLNEGKSCDLVQYAQIDVAEGTYTNAQIGAKVYLGANGAYTFTQNTTVGQLDQWIGKVWSTGCVLLDISNDPEGITVESPTQTLTVAGANAVAEATKLLYLNNAATAITATIADASKHEGFFFVEAGLEPAGAQDHTVTLTSGTWNPTGDTIATFADISDSILVAFDSSGNGTVLVNTGSVTFS